MKKHLGQGHAIVFNKYKAARKSRETGELEGRSLAKKRKQLTPLAITGFFGSANPYKKGDPAEERFLEDLVLHIAKGYRPLSSVETAWLRKLVLHQCGQVIFPSRQLLVDEVFPSMVAKTMDRYILPSITKCVTPIASFDLWMSRGGFDTFALIINFLEDAWKPQHNIVAIFEAPDTSGATMAMQVRDLLQSFNLTNKTIAYVKDEGANLNILTAALTSIVSCGPLQLAQPYAGTCFGHVMSNCCQYATNEDKICNQMHEISLEDAQAVLQKTITWTKKLNKGRQEWVKACLDASL